MTLTGSDIALLRLAKGSSRAQILNFGMERKKRYAAQPSATTYIDPSIYMVIEE